MRGLHGRQLQTSLPAQGKNCQGQNCLSPLKQDLHAFISLPFILTKTQNHVLIQRYTGEIFTILNMHVMVSRFIMKKQTTVIKYFKFKCPSTKISPCNQIRHK